MITLSPALYNAIHSTANQPVDLYELYLTSGTYYFADQDITWGGTHYLPQVKSRTAVKQSVSGQFDTVTITFSNVDTTMAQLLLTNDIEGQRVIIRKIDKSVPDDSMVIFNGIMTRPNKLDEDEASVDATQIVGNLTMETPARTFTQFCGWQFKGAECGYAGAALDCDRSWATCNSLGNTDRWGGFRFIPHTGSLQIWQIGDNIYTQPPANYWLQLRARRKTLAYQAYDDTPYDVGIPLVFGRAEMASIIIEHENIVGIGIKMLSAFCVGIISNILYVRVNGVLGEGPGGASDYTAYIGLPGDSRATPAPNTQGVDPRFPDSYPYSYLAYLALDVPANVAVADPAPEVRGVVMGIQCDIYDDDGSWAGACWTDNPVWCVRKYMSMPATQGGMGIPDSWFDDAVHATEAAYCDELIPDSTGDQTIIMPPWLPLMDDNEGAYQRFMSTGVSDADPTVGGPYTSYAPTVDDEVNPPTVMVKRFTMNVAITQNQKAVDQLFQVMLPAFRGYLNFSKTGKIQIRVERPVQNTTVSASAAAGVTSLQCMFTSDQLTFPAGSTVLLSPFTPQAETVVMGVTYPGTQGGWWQLTFASATKCTHAAGDAIMQIAMAFDDTNIAGKVQYPLCTDKQDTTNRVTIKYTDAPAGFESRQLEVNDYENQAKVNVVNNLDQDGSAIDSYFQAWRIGEWLRARARDLGQFCEFPADITANVLELGDVIALSAKEFGLQCVPFRVTDLSYEENDEVTIDGQLYSLDVYNDQAPRTTVTIPALFGTTQTGGAASQPVIADVTGVGVTGPVPVLVNGSVQAQIVLTYNAPATLGTGDAEFAGIEVRCEQPAQVLDLGFQKFSGAAGALVAVTITLPYPAAAQSWNVYFQPRSDKYTNPLIFKGNEGETPNVTVAMPSLATATTAAPVTNQTAAVVNGLDAQGGQTFLFDGYFTPPADPNFQYCEIVAVWDDDPTHEAILGDYGATNTAGGMGQPTWVTGSSPMPGAARGVTVKFYSVNQAGARNTASVPTVHLTVSATVGTLGEEYAPLVTNFTAAVVYGYDQAGNQTYGYSGSWTNPVGDPRYGGLKIVCQDAGGNNTVLLVASAGSSIFNTPQWPCPTSATFTVYGISVDGSGRANTIAAPTPQGFQGTPNVVLTVQKQVGIAGAEYASKATGFTASVNYSVNNEIGGQMYGFTASWTNPIGDVKFQGVVVFAVSGAFSVQLTGVCTGTTVTTPSWAVPSATQSWTLYAVSVDASGRQNSYVPGVTPSCNVSVSPSTGNLRLHRADSSTVGAGLENTGTQLRIPLQGVDSTLLGYYSVLYYHLASGAVQSAAIASGAVLSAHLGTGAVVRAALANAAVGNSQLDLLSVANGNIQDGVIASAKIAAVAIEKVTAGTCNVASAPVYFNGSQGVQIIGGGNLTLTPGTLAAAGATFTTAGQGWSIVPGPSSYISGNGYISAGSYINANAGFQVGGAAGATGSFQAQNSSGVWHTLWISGGLVTAIV